MFHLLGWLQLVQVYCCHPVMLLLLMMMMATTQSADRVQSHLLVWLLQCMVCGGSRT